MSDVQTAAPIATAPTAAVATSAPVAKAVAGFAPTGEPVHAVKAENATSVIRPYEGKDSGYIVIQQNCLDFSNPMWPKNKLRSTLVKGKLDLLQQIVNNMVDKRTLNMPGKLILEEVLYDEAFQAEVEAARDKATYKPGQYKEYVAQLNLKADDEDTMLKNVVKRAGKDGPFLTKHVEGEDVMILKFTRYQVKANAQGEYDADTTISHDNHEEIADYRAANPQDKAEDNN